MRKANAWTGKRACEQRIPHTRGLGRAVSEGRKLDCGGQGDPARTWLAPPGARLAHTSGKSKAAQQSTRGRALHIPCRKHSSFTTDSPARTGAPHLANGNCPGPLPRCLITQQPGPSSADTPPWRSGRPPQPPPRSRTRGAAAQCPPGWPAGAQHSAAHNKHSTHDFTIRIANRARGRRAVPLRVNKSSRMGQQFSTGSRGPCCN
jgi:hypothetical protein